MAGAELVLVAPLLGLIRDVIQLCDTVKSNRVVCDTLASYLNDVSINLTLLQENMGWQRDVPLAHSISEKLSKIKSSVEAAKSVLQNCIASSYGNFVMAVLQSKKVKDQLKVVSRRIRSEMESVDRLLSTSSYIMLGQLFHANMVAQTQTLPANALVISPSEEASADRLEHEDCTAATAATAPIVVQDKKLRLCLRTPRTADAWESFVFKLEGFSKIMEESIILSDEVEVGGISWALLADIEEVNAKGLVLSLFLYVTGEDAPPRGWRQFVSYTLEIVNQGNSKNSIHRGDYNQKFSFNDRLANRGFREMAEKHKLETLNSGFLVDDALQIKLSIEPHARLQLVHPLYSFARTDALRFQLAKFSQCRQGIVHSDTVKVGDIEWALKLELRRSQLANSSPALSIYLVVANAEDLPPGWKRDMMFSIEFMHSTGSPLEIGNVRSTLDGSRNCRGHTNIMRLEDISRGYLVDDTLTIAARVYFE